jgi:hypothetical protein
MWDKVKGLGAVILAVGVFLLIALLIALFVHGGAWLGEKAYPWLVSISAFTLAVSVLVLLPLSFFRRTRGFAAVGLLISSYVFGLNLWVWGLLLTYHLWGAWAVILGLFIIGVGVVPFAMLATLFKGMWPQLGELIFLTVLVFGLRAYSIHLANKADSEGYAE